MAQELEHVKNFTKTLQAAEQKMMQLRADFKGRFGVYIGIMENKLQTTLLI